MRQRKMIKKKIYKIAKAIYEACRMEAIWSCRPIVPEHWKDRDEDFKKQFISIVDKYLTIPQLPTPKEAHESWVASYKQMGWRYGPVRDAIKKTHPDLVSFEELPVAEREKDSIFLAFIWLIRKIGG